MFIKFLNGTTRQINTYKGANLRGADLSGANLRSAELAVVDLSCADLTGVDLSHANLRGADLRGANLRGADLWGARMRGANLVGANLLGANLSGANLRGADLKDAKLDYQIVPGLLEQIAQVVLADPDRLKMESWHSACGTAHSLAGWACKLAPNGKELERKNGTEVAGLLLLGAEAHSLFFKTDEEVLDWLKEKVR